MKKLLRILPYLTMVWVAMYVHKDGEIVYESNKRWTTKKQCMKEALKTATGVYYSMTEGDYKSIKYHKPVCYRLTKYSTR